MTGLEGMVIIRAWVNTDGTVRKALAVISSDYIFIGPVLDAIMDWKFSSTNKNGKLIEVSIFMPFYFKLNENSKY